MSTLRSTGSASKALRVTEILVRFNSPQLTLFGGPECSPLGPKLLIMHIHPGEGITAVPPATPAVNAR